MTTKSKNNSTLSETEVQKSLSYSVKDGCAYSVMVGFGESYITPYAVFLRASNLEIGFLASLPQLLGAICQWFGAEVVDKLRRRKSFVVGGAALQALTWIPMMLIPPLFGPQGPMALIVLFVVYFSTVSSVVPGWNSWMGDLVPEETRGRFFGRRNRITGTFAFVSMLVAGGVLHLFESLEYEAMGFVVIFSVAFLARVVSVLFLNRMHEPPYEIAEEDYFSFWDFIRRSPKSNFARFVFYIAFTNFAVFFSAPFFAVYMLRDLKFTYLEFTLASAAMAITQFLMMYNWGRIGDRFGNKKVLTLTGFGIAIIPILWLLSTSWPYIVMVQAISGIVWSGFLLASANYIFDAVTPPKRARCVAYYNVINGLFSFLGAMAGGYVSNILPSSMNFGFFSLSFISGLPFIFLISGCLRFIVYFVMIPLFRELREVEPISTTGFIFRITHIKPITGFKFDIFTAHRNHKRKAET